MNREQKAAAIDEIAANIEESQAIFAVDYRGISVPQVAELRAKLREADATFRVVKNSLTERAADQAGAAELKALLQGPTALTFVRGDAAAGGQGGRRLRPHHPAAAVQGRPDGRRAVDADQIRAISRLPSREVLYGQLVGVVASPITGLVRTLSALIGGLAVALGQVHEKKESGELPAGEPPAAAQAPTAEQAPAPAGETAPEETPKDQAEPVQEPAQDDNQADASAEEQPETAEATKED